MRTAIVTVLICLSAMARAATVEVNAPLAGATISGNAVEVKVTFTSTADKPVTKVQVFLDSVFITERVLDPAQAQGSCSFAWDTVRTPNGPHKVDFQVFSKEQNVATGSVSVSVANQIADLTPPRLTVLSPKDGEKVSGTTKILIDASDDSSSEPYVSIYIDGSLRCVSNHGPYTYAWDTRTGEDRAYVIKVVAVDQYGNKSEAKPVRVTVRNAGK